MRRVRRLPLPAQTAGSCATKRIPPSILAASADGANRSPSLKAVRVARLKYAAMNLPEHACRKIWRQQMSETRQVRDWRRTETLLLASCYLKAIVPLKRWKR